MIKKAGTISTEKTDLHPRNPHRFRYDFAQLIKSCPDLAPFVSLNKYENESIDFANPDAVKLLNKALLKHFYTISNWDIPKNYLCPPIPGRADYIHYMADLLASSNNGVIQTGKSIVVLDIGVGANCVYPIIGTKEYGWTFVGSDIDPVAIESAKRIVDANDFLKEKVTLRLQKSTAHILKDLVKPEDIFDISICNPPFHGSLEEAMAGTQRKVNNLGTKKVNTPVLNFGGQNTELWTPGGEVAFIGRMISESAELKKNCFWYSTLVSQKSNLLGVYWALKKAGAVLVKTIDMAQGQKKSRIVAWTFLDELQQKEWTF